MRTTLQRRIAASLRRSPLALGTPGSSFRCHCRADSGGPGSSSARTPIDRDRTSRGDGSTGRIDDAGGGLPSVADPGLGKGAEPDASVDPGPARGFRLPPPTWSVSDLQLGVDHEPISDGELRELCRRACLLPPSPRDDSSRQLAQDVGNLIHLIEQVRSIDPGRLVVGSAASADSLRAPSRTSATTVRDEGDGIDSEEDRERARLVYDAPRGVSPAGGSYGGAGDPPGDFAAEDLADGERVRESLLRPKMTAVGGHRYFAVRTGEAARNTGKAQQEAPE